MKLEKIALKKFLCRFPLQLGGYIVGIIYISLMVILIITTLVQIVSMQKNADVINKYPWRNAYGYTITGLLYYGVVLAVNILFAWGIYKSNRTIILIWVVVTSLWIFLALCGLLSMVVVTSEDPDMDKAHWILRLIFGLLGIAGLSYGVLVGLSIWIDLKKSKFYVPSRPPSLTSTAPKRTPPTLKTSPSKTISHRKQTPRSTPVPSETAIAMPTVQIAATPPPSQRVIQQPEIPASQPPQQIPLTIYPTASPQILMPQATIPAAPTPMPAPQVINPATSHHTQRPQPPVQMPPAIKPTASIPEPLLNDGSTDSFSPENVDDVTRRRSRK